MIRTSEMVRNRSRAYQRNMTPTVRAYVTGGLAYGEYHDDQHGRHEHRGQGTKVFTLTPVAGSASGRPAMALSRCQRAAHNSRALVSLG